MQLLECYIENFGTLHQFEFHFTNGLNVIEEENGWGKTTFAAFIKAMFYGMEYSTSRKKITDRKRYYPWNGNKFGGYLVFEISNKRYKLERYFGKKDKDDTFQLYDLATNLASTDFDETIGERIWQLDRDSYEKTAFLTLNDSPLLNDIISGKLGNIESQEADLEKSQNAILHIEKEMTKIKALRGKNGILNLKKEELASTKTDLKKCEQSIEQIKQLEQWIQEEKEKLAAIKHELHAINEEEDNFVLLERKKQYEELLLEYQTKEKELNDIKEFFHGMDIKKEDLDTLREQVTKKLMYKEQMQQNELLESEQSELEKLEYKFHESIPKEYEIEACNDDLRKLSNKRTEWKAFTISVEEQQKFDTLHKQYQDNNMQQIDTFILDYQRVMELSELENDVKNKIERLELEKMQKSEQKKIIHPLMLVGLILLILGIAMAFKNGIVGVGICILAIIIIFVSYLKYANSKKDTAQQKQKSLKQKELREELLKISKEKKSLEMGYHDFLRKSGKKQDQILFELSNAKSELKELLQLQKRIAYANQKRKELNIEIQKLTERIQTFLGRYMDIECVIEYAQAVEGLRKQLRTYESLSEKNKDYQFAKSKVNEIEPKINKVLTTFYKKVPTDLQKAVEQIAQQYQTLSMTAQALQLLAKKKEKFEQENEIEQIQSISFLQSDLEGYKKELKNKKEMYLEKQTDIQRKIAGYEKDINTQSLLADQKEDLESKIHSIEEEIKDLSEQYEILSATKEYIEKAKEHLAQKYMGTISAVFKKYLNETEAIYKNKYLLNIKLDVEMELYGQRHEMNELSTGMKDLIQICMRLALVEAVYKNVEKPILILDDPFVNLDNIRLKNVAKLIEKLALNYQCIYFICHSSRKIFN